MPTTLKPELKITSIEKDFPISDLNDRSWERAYTNLVTTYWSGRAAPTGRQFSVRLLWSKTALYVRFDADSPEPLVVSERPDLSGKTMGLWEKDVCEIFVAPNLSEPRKYFEFEVAPTGEWIDLRIDSTSGDRISDWAYGSGMVTAAEVLEDKIVMAIKVPWKGIGKTPKAGDFWLGNVFRCVGKDPNRGYLAWSPTKTAAPNFHVPEKFGSFVFAE